MVNKKFLLKIKELDNKNKKAIKYLNIFSFLLVVYIILNFFNLSFQNNNYELLNMDERLIIDDIYNVWTQDDVFNNFENIQNIFIKKILIILSEMVYGNDLRYGRLWSNFYIILIGPLTLFFNDSVVIAITRIINIIIFFSALNVLINNFVSKKYKWIIFLLFYCLPGIDYYNTTVKPDPFLILLIGFAMILIKKEKYYLSLFTLAVATGLKIIGIFTFLPTIFYLFLNNKLNLNLKNFFKIGFLSWLAIVLVNPILLLPPLSFGPVPNFWMKYYLWIDSQSKWTQKARFDIEYFLNWSNSINSYFFNDIKNNYIVYLIYIFLTFYLIKSIKRFDDLNSIFLISGYIYLFYILFTVERQWLLYLHFPLIFIIIAVNNFSNNKVIILIFILLTPSGLFKLQQFFNSEKVDLSFEIIQINSVLA